MGVDMVVHGRKTPQSFSTLASRCGTRRNVGTLTDTRVLRGFPPQMMPCTHVRLLKH